MSRLTDNGRNIWKNFEILDILVTMVKITIITITIVISIIIALYLRPIVHVLLGPRLAQEGELLEDGAATAQLHEAPRAKP